MSRAVAKLSALSVAKLAKTRSDRTRLHHDGGGLYLIVDHRGHSTSWTYRYTLNGRARMLGLGRYPEISLQDAREKAAEMRRQKAHGIDPQDARLKVRSAEKTEKAREVPFEALCEEFIRNKESGWSNLKHGSQWRSTLATYAYPNLGRMAVGHIRAEDVLAVLRQPIRSDSGTQPLWEVRPETASRLRGRIEAVLDYAKVKQLREGDNPAAWRGNLKLALPDKTKVRQVKPHRALPIDELPGLMKQLGLVDAPSARALEFAILTAARTSEALGAQWSEIDLKAGIWSVPAERMKAAREHRIPLPPSAMSLLRNQAAHAGTHDYVFVNSKGQKFSNMALLMLLKRMGRSEITVHGFRSTFRDWAAERTTFPRELAEKALAHTLGSKVEAAYQRSDLLERRRELMENWDRWCAGGSDPVPIGPA